VALVGKMVAPCQAERGICIMDYENKKGLMLWERIGTQFNTIKKLSIQ
jgi:hypothetical protein